MRFSFVHTADNHLGYEQYGLHQRFDDFARAFLSVVDGAIARQADFFVVAGDLFNKRAIDAQTLMQAQTGLERLRAAGIPAIAIEGNHDRSYYRDGVSWLQFMCWQKLLYLLSPQVVDGVPDLAPWDEQTMRGAYVDLKGGRVRVYGLPWYGASTPKVMEGFARALEANRATEDAAGVEYRVLLMHTGLEGIVPMMHGLPTYEQFLPLRPLVDYVGLGHVHKQYERDGWLYNPGSTETWGAEESAWDRGYYVVNADTNTPEGEPRHAVEHVVNPRRPFLRFIFRVDGLDDPTALYDRFERDCARWARESENVLASSNLEPVIDVGLHGVLRFDAGAFERPRLEEMARAAFLPEPLTVRIHDSMTDSSYEIDEPDEERDGQDRSTWQQLEVHIFQELVARDARYTEHAPEWARVLAELKQMALSKEEPVVIASHLRAAREKLLS
jgi:DNA repair exonuclease SbcCD nuclease subunit